MNMSLVEESRLEELSQRLRRATLGHVREIFLDQLGDTLFVHLRADRYYGLQLAIAEMDRWAATEGREFSVQLSAEVKGNYYRLRLADSGAPLVALNARRCPGLATSMAGEGEGLR